jgi:hypothetical protein
VWLKIGNFQRSIFFIRNTKCLKSNDEIYKKIYIYNQTDNQPQEYNTYTHNHQSTKPNEQPTTTIGNTTPTTTNLVVFPIVVVGCSFGFVDWWLLV